MHEGQPLSRAQQSRATRLHQSLTGLVRHAAEAAQQGRRGHVPAATAPTGDGPHHAPSHSASGDGGPLADAEHPRDASRSAFTFPSTASAHAGQSEPAPSRSLTTAGAASHTEPDAHDIQLAESLRDGGSRRERTSPVEDSTDCLAYQEHQRSARVPRNFPSGRAPLISPGAERIVEQLLQGAGGALATAAELSAAVRGFNTRITGRRAPARQPRTPSATTDLVGTLFSNDNTRDPDQGISQSGPSRGTLADVDLRPAPALLVSQESASPAMQTEMGASGQAQPGPTAEQAAGASASIQGQQLEVGVSTPTMIQLAMPMTSPSPSARPSVALQQAGSSDQPAEAPRGTNVQQGLQQRQHRAPAARRNKTDLAQRVLLNVERFVRANESLLPWLQMPSSMALAAATERAVGQLAAKNLLPDPEHSLQGRYHEFRMLQRVEVCQGFCSKFQLLILQACLCQRAQEEL